MRYLNVQSLLWLALALALAGSLKHLASIFASVDGNYLMGWLQAIAIDTGLFALTYSIRQRKAEKRSTKPLWAGIALFTLISIYGNLAYGILATTGKLPGWLSAMQPIVLAASLPILVLFLSELLSDNQQYVARLAQREQKKVAKQRIATDGLTSVNAQKQATKQTKMAELAKLIADQPEASNTELATMLGVSRGTIRNYKQALNGQVAQ